MSNNPLNVSFDNGFGPFGNRWNVMAPVNGEIKLTGNSGIMEWATGKDAGHGYGTYTVTAKVDGNKPGPAIVLWPGNDKWPGQEIDMLEVTPDGSGRHYGTVHWNANGSDAYSPKIFDGVKGGVFHNYTMVWEPGKITFKVDGVTKGTVTSHVPKDYDHGGMNDTIGFLNNNPNTSLTIAHVKFTPLGQAAPAPSAAPAPESTESSSVVKPVASKPIVASATDAHTDAADWASISAQVTANYEATGRWEWPTTTAAKAAPAPVVSSPAPHTDGPVDWDAVAAQVHANFEATGQWFI